MDLAVPLIRILWLLFLSPERHLGLFFPPSPISIQLLIHTAHNLRHTTSSPPTATAWAVPGANTVKGVGAADLLVVMEAVECRKKSDLEVVETLNRDLAASLNTPHVVALGGVEQRRVHPANVLCALSLLTTLLTTLITTLITHRQSILTRLRVSPSPITP